jgi:hypothetical protein
MSNMTDTWSIMRDVEKGEHLIDCVDKEGRIKGIVFGKEIHEGLFHTELSEIQFKTIEQQYIGTSALFITSSYYFSSYYKWFI